MSQMDIACPGIRENGRTPSKEPLLNSSAVLSVTGSVWYSPELTLWTMWADGSLCRPGVCCTTCTDAAIQVLLPCGTGWVLTAMITVWLETGRTDGRSLDAVGAGPRFFLPLPLFSLMRSSQLVQAV